MRRGERCWEDDTAWETHVDTLLSPGPARAEMAKNCAGWPDSGGDGRGGDATSKGGDALLEHVL